MPGHFCKVSPSWPFPSTCAEYLKTGDRCMSDYECSITDFCWYPNAQSVANDIANKTPLTSFKQCMKKYAAEDGTVFGWRQANDAQIALADFV